MSSRNDFQVTLSHMKRSRPAAKTATKKVVAKKKLSKSDPNYYAKIGKISGEKLLEERGTAYFSAIAKKSHPRAKYFGGRPPKSQNLPG